MATTIKIKSTTTVGKTPTTSDIEVSELALNLADKKLYSRNAAGIFEIGKLGETPSGGSGDRPASPEPGDIFYDTTLGALLYWNGSAWVPIGADAVALNDLTDVDTSGVTDGMVIAYDQATSTWTPVTPASLTVEVDLGYTAATTTGTITNNAGDNAVIPAATTSAAGLTTAADKQKLDGIEAGAEVNPNLTNYLQKGDNISELVNDAGYITSGGGGGGGGDAVQLNDNGVRQSIVGGGGLDVLGGISTQFGTPAAQLGNLAPLNDWSCYPARA